VTVGRASQSFTGELSLAVQTFNEEIRGTQTIAEGIMAIATRIRRGRVGLEFSRMEPDQIRSEISNIQALIDEYRILELTGRDGATFDALGLNNRAAGILGRETALELQDAAEEAGISYMEALTNALFSRQRQARSVLEDTLRPVEASGTAPLTPTGNTATTDLLTLLRELDPVMERYADQRERAADAAAREAAFARDMVGRAYAGLETEMRYEAGGELARLQDELDQRLFIIREHQRLVGGEEADYEARRTALMAQYAADRNMMIAASASEGFGSLAVIMRESLGEQSAAYQAMFALSKGFAIAESIIAIQVAISKALALGFPQNIPFMAAAAAQGASIIQTITSTQPGYQSGTSWTGSGPVGGVAGVVHNQEAVLNAPARAGIGGPAIDYMNRHHALPPSGGGSGGGGSKVFQFDMRGAVVTEDMMRQINEAIRSGDEQSVATAVKYAARDTNGKLERLARPQISAGRR